MLIPSSSGGQALEELTVPKSDYRCDFKLVPASRSTHRASHEYD